MATPLEDIQAAITLLKNAPARGRLDSNNAHLLQHVAALMRLREPLIAWLEAEYLALMPLVADLDQEHAVLAARSLLTPVTGRPGPGQPGLVVDNMRAALDSLLREA